MWPALTETWPFINPTMDVSALSAAEWRSYMEALEEKAAEARRQSRKR